MGIEIMKMSDLLHMRRWGWALGCVLVVSDATNGAAWAQRRTPTEPVVTLLDTDRNRSISSAEMEAAPERLMAADGNQDGTVTPEEVEAHLSYLRENRPGIIQTDFPYQMSAVGAPFPEGNVAKKGMAIRVGNGASMLFDTDLVRIAAGWTGGLITTTGVTFDGSHGGYPRISGKQTFGTPELPGWANAEGQFIDTREEPFGPIDASVARWGGHYLVGDQVVLQYDVAGTRIHEQPSSVALGGQVGFVRSLQIGASPAGQTRPLKLLVAEQTGENGDAQAGAWSVVSDAGQETRVVLTMADDAAVLSREGDWVVLEVAPATKPRLVQLLIWSGAKESRGVVASLRQQPVDWVSWEQGGPSRWPEPVITKGQLAVDDTPDGAYVVDRLTPPIENPWNRRLRLGGFDFFADGQSAAFCTWDGDVWLVEGIDEDLDALVWKRFASGLFESLGLKIVDEVIYVSSRVGIMRLHDLNDDGTCDYYENFNNELTSSVGFHEFVFDLHTDADGNFYYAKAGPVRGGGRGFGSRPNENHRFGDVSAHAGTVLRVDPTGQTMEVYATGFRAPNGIGVGPDGQVTTGDNEGTWIPACPINWVEPGGFYGVEDLAHRESIPTFQPPLCWLSKREFDNSGGSQVWVTSDRWGPFEGSLLHLSYGRCALYLVMKQQVGDQMQGGVVQLPVKFASSAMRARFNERDGQLYVAGLRGWQTRAAQISGFDRVRYTGKPYHTVRDIRVDTDGIHLTFSQALDPESAGDVENYTALQWNYRRSSDYGSRDYWVSEPERVGREPVEIQSAELSEDRRTVTLAIEGLQPVMQFLIDFSIDAADGELLRQKTLQTIHQIPAARG